MKTSLENLISMAMFARVVESGSLSAAAATLSVSKSAVSKRLAALEERLGVRLLHRTTRRITLTPEGAELFEHCLQLLRAADGAPELHPGSEPRGLLRVSAPAIFSDALVAEAIADFVRSHPRVEVDLRVSNAMVHMIGEQIDVALRVSRTLESSSLIARRLATAPQVVCVAPAYIEARGTPATPADLRGHACLRFSRLRPEVEWRFRDGRSETAVPVSGPIVSDDVEALRRSAIAGAGIIVVPRFFVAPDIDAGRLVPLLEQYASPELGVFAVYSKGKLVPAKIRAFVAHLATHARAARWR
jgi:DNA-binding transcriptional LysR family regulator